MGLAYGFRGLVHYLCVGDMITGRQAQFWRCSWELISDPQIANRVNQVQSSVDFLIPKAIFQLTHLLQQSHTCFNKATPSNTSQTVPLTENQTFKHLNIWGPNLFKPPQISNWSLWVSSVNTQVKQSVTSQITSHIFWFLDLYRVFLLYVCCIFYLLLPSLSGHENKISL